MSLSAAAVQTAGPRLSETLRRMAQFSGARFSVADLIGSLGEGSFGGALMVMALPATMLPPLVSAALGAPLLLVSAQMILGAPRLSLPSAIGRLSLSRRHAVAALHRSARGVARLEGMLRPRMTRLQGRLHLKLVAGGCLTMSAVLCLPTPVAHTAAGLSIGMFAAGMLHRDGLALLAGWVLASLSLGIVALMAGVAWLGLRLI